MREGYASEDWLCSVLIITERLTKVGPNLDIIDRTNSSLYGLGGYVGGERGNVPRLWKLVQHSQPSEQLLLRLGKSSFLEPASP
jgi:hypothetical protein